MRHKPVPPMDYPINLWMTREQVAALDAWRAKYQVWSRSEAIRRMIAEGLSRDTEQLADAAD